MPERPDGFYWVRDFSGNEEIAHWNGRCWRSPEWDEPYYDAELKEIGERVERVNPDSEEGMALRAAMTIVGMREVPLIRTGTAMVPHSVMVSQINAAVAAEREACAKIADEEARGWEEDGIEPDLMEQARLIAQKIRERK